MTFTAFLVVYALCAAAMALWIDVRFPRLVPEDLKSAMVRLLVGVVVVHVLLAASDRLVRPFPAALESWLLLGLGFALLTVGMLTTIWVFRVCLGMLGGSLR